MLNDQFEKIVAAQCEDILNRCRAKGAEYTGKDTDRLGNFKRVAGLMRCTPEKALAGLVAKHVVATYDFIDDLEKGQLRPMEQWDEKLGDIILYAILLKALLMERHQDARER
jgi:hypothetical protein